MPGSAAGPSIHPTRRPGAADDRAIRTVPPFPASPRSTGLSRVAAPARRLELAQFSERAAARRIRRSIWDVALGESRRGGRIVIPTGDSNGLAPALRGSARTRGENQTPSSHSASSPSPFPAGNYTGACSSVLRLMLVGYRRDPRPVEGGGSLACLRRASGREGGTVTA
ncbi:hypothetical protein DL765_000558 [Monosporascus sp. GIB2]|nr:hypothetical protein DL765_000558 [Monosporascus sp. GIB2]